MVEIGGTPDGSLRMTGTSLSAAPKTNALTVVEAKALRLIANGFDQAVVAHQLGISIPAVHGITTRMRRRLGAKNMTQMIYMAVKRGWIE
jgi:DNA-binding NarL/FixJ family response regulator